jgi:UDP-N-acetyl-D-glucosamine dehydrogenase
MTDAGSVASERLFASIQQRTARCAVVGLGMVGGMQARMLTAAGFSVTGYDTNPAVVDAFLRTVSDDAFVGRCNATTSEAALADAEVVFVCVRVGIDAGGEPDTAALQATAAALTRHRIAPTLVIIVTTVAVGTTSRFSTEWLGHGDGNRWFVASAPERIAAQQSFAEVVATPRLVAGVDDASGELADAMLSAICARAVRVSRPEVCELSKLLENTFRTQAIALVSEVTRAANAFGISASEVCEAAATKPFGYFPFFPGAGVGGHCLPNDLKLLARSCHDAGTPSPLLAAVAGVIGDMPDVAIRRLETLIGKPLEGARVLIVGVGFKPGADDLAASPAFPLMEHLLNRQARLAYFDDHAANVSLSRGQVERIEMVDLPARRFDAAVIVAGARTIDLRSLHQVADLVLDVGGAKIMEGNVGQLHRL